MKKDGIYRVFIAAFLCLCLLPLAAMPIVGESEPAANELPVSKPELLDGDGALNTAYTSQLSDYIANRFAFRRELVTAWSALNAAVLGSSAEEQLILGREGWLFFSETLGDYMGIGLSDGLLQSAANNLALMQEYLVGQGKSFVFTIAPNKNSLYPEYMPRRYASNRSASNAARLGDLLRELGVEYVDLFAAFAGQGVLYYSGDSHWTAQGAALAADSLLRRMGRADGYSRLSFSPGPLHRGDLYQMLYPSRPGQERDMECEQDFTYECLGDPAAGNAMNIDTGNSAGAGSLLCYRDSFGVALYPYLAQSFENARFSRAAAYDLTAASAADTVIIELVERNIGYLVEYAPCFPAPERDIGPGAAGPGEVAVSYTEGGSGLVQISGQLSREMCDEGSRLYVRAGGAVLEACVLRSNGQGPRFSLWTEQGYTAQAVLCMRDGVLTEYSVIASDKSLSE